MPNRITANLPSHSFDATIEFYGRLGFTLEFLSDDWMILTAGELEVEFFSHPQLEPRESCFSACVRVDELEPVFVGWQRAGLSDSPLAIPRLTGIVKLPDVPRMFAMVDADGSLLRVLENGG